MYLLRPFHDQAGLGRYEYSCLYSPIWSTINVEMDKNLSTVNNPNKTLDVAIPHHRFPIFTTYL